VRLHHHRLESSHDCPRHSGFRLLHHRAWTCRHSNADQDLDLGLDLDLLVAAVAGLGAVRQVSMGAVRPVSMAAAEEEATVNSVLVEQVSSMEVAVSSMEALANSMEAVVSSALVAAVGLPENLFLWVPHRAHQNKCAVLGPPSEHNSKLECK
jgi:hypothetical protein